MFRCPICKRAVDDATVGKPGSTFPFCSERCKLIDLGRWLDGKYQIPVVEDEEAKSPPPEGRRFAAHDEDEN